MDFPLSSNISIPRKTSEEGSMNTSFLIHGELCTNGKPRDQLENTLDK